MDEAIKTTVHVKRGAFARTTDIAAMVSESKPARKIKKAKTARGNRSGNALTTNIGTSRNSQTTIPQSANPRDVMIISFFK